MENRDPHGQPWVHLSLCKLNLKRAWYNRTRKESFIYHTYNTATLGRVRNNAIKEKQLISND